MQRIIFHVAHHGPDDFALTIDGREHLRFDDGGRRAQVVGEGFDAADLFRWGAALGLAAQGVVCLHGAAVRDDAVAIAVLGVGGAGKSTLARQLAAATFEPVLDDVLVVDRSARVDLAGEGVIQAFAAEAATRGVGSYTELAARLAKRPQWLPLRTVVVLGDRLPAPSVDIDMSDAYGHPAPWDAPCEFELTELAGLPGLTEISLHRFGSHPNPRAWEHQLAVFAAITDRTRVARLRSPDGLFALAQVIPALARALRA